MAHESVVVVPIGGAVGDAKAIDVVAGKTFSSKQGKGLTGTLEPNAVSIGDAQDADVLVGKTFSNVDNIGLSGSMPDNGAVTITPGTVNQPISQGYHDGNGTCEGDMDLMPENIPAGVTIFGVTGTLAQQFTNNRDGTVTDNLSRLMWQQADNGSGYNWSAANSYCAGLDLGGHPIGSWRLPTKDELKGLVRCSNGTPTPLPDTVNCGVSYTNPTIDGQFSCRTTFYWSSSVSGQSDAWGVRFFFGDSALADHAGSNYVRCVR